MMLAVVRAVLGWLWRFGGQALVVGYCLLCLVVAFGGGLAAVMLVLGLQVLMVHLLRRKGGGDAAGAGGGGAGGVGGRSRVGTGTPGPGW